MPNTKAILQLNVVLEPCFLKYLPTGGKKPIPVPITLIPSFAAQDSCAAGRYAEGTHIIINGRVYPHAEDGKLYVVPTQPLESLKMPVNLNQVNIAGSVGYIGEQRREDAFNFGMMVQAPPQKSIGHTWQDSLGFKVESWGDDAERMKKFLLWEELSLLVEHLNLRVGLIGMVTKEIITK